MRFYAIVDTNNGNYWSRNHWGSPRAAPDLYITYAAAQRQIDKGKVSVMKYYNPAYQPAVVLLRLTNLGTI